MWSDEGRGERVSGYVFAAVASRIARSAELAYVLQISALSDRQDEGPDDYHLGVLV